MKKGEEMWKTELETLRAIAAIGKSSVRMPDIVALFPSLLPRTIYYRVERLVDHGLVTKKKSDYRWNEITITVEGKVMLKCPANSPITS
jgi:DNA-binding HxlR family transcriptional regulator